MSTVAARLAAVASLVLVLLGCETEVDDELRPRPTETVTVTNAPEPAPAPARLPIVEGEEVDPAVVWTSGTVLHRDAARTDLGPQLVPSASVVVPGGLLVLADGVLWSVTGRDAAALPLPEVSAVTVSEDGAQVLVEVVDRPRPLAYDSRTGERQRQALAGRGEARTLRGPGPVRLTGDGEVLDARGEPVAVSDLPVDLEVAGWRDAGTWFGTSETGVEGEGPTVVTCTVTPATDPETGTCRDLAALDGTSAPVFAAYPAG